MNQDVKKMWVDALRSGDYRQGQYYLMDESDGFCCLGVLCDLHAKAYQHEWVRNSDDAMEYLDCTEILPDEVREWAGLRDCCPDVSPGFVDSVRFVTETAGSGRRLLLAELNDDHAFTFAELADVIEKGL